MSHKVKNPIPAKQTTLADVTSSDVQPWKVAFSSVIKCLSFLTSTRLKVTTITKDVYIPTRLKKWIMVDNVRKKVPAGEGVLKEYHTNDVLTLVEETTSERRFIPDNA